MADAVVKRVLLAAEARMASRAAKDNVTRKLSSLKLNLPGKLADCSSNKVEETELFIVEGDSAGGSAKMARDRKTQAVLVAPRQDPERGAGSVTRKDPDEQRDQESPGHARLRCRRSTSTSTGCVTAA